MNRFQTIGIIGKHRSHDITDCLQLVIDYLTARGLKIIVDEDTAHVLEKQSGFSTCHRQQLGGHCDLVIAVGGDGCFLGAARDVAVHKTPIVGINRGHLGFLTDILPQQMQQQLDHVFNGEYHEEERFLLKCNITDGNHILADGEALNEVVLSPGDSAHMIDFNVYINSCFVSSHRSDGIIVATPTGSTAYALSGGGPILHPALNAMVLVPMFPHKLTSRPIVVNADSRIDIHILDSNETSPKVSFDGHARVPVPPNGKIHIQKFNAPLRLIHPLGYDFYETLRSKLGWESNLDTRN